MTIHHDQDLEDFRSGLNNYLDGRWFEDRWKTFRLRFGIYEQRQSAQHMVRIKVPGGRLTLDQARTIAQANAAHAGGDIHITTRQGAQLYFTPLEHLDGLLTALNTGGVSTREASGNTFRAITACPHAGACAEELTDAATVAERLTETWLRHPLTQHMPRKVKTTVSGCGRDCGLSAIDDLGFIATERGGEFGFRVTVGGGLGIAPVQAIEVFDFVPEADLPRVQEAFARVHQAHSDRTNKNRARIKFLIKRLGAEAFIAEFHRVFDKLAGLDGPALRALDWQAVIDQNKRTVEVEVPLGWMSSRQLSELADLAEQAGGDELRLTRTQNIIAKGLAEESVDAFVNGVRKLGLDASGRGHAFQDFVSCPGASTCAIGITDSFALSETLLDAAAEFEGYEGVRLRISGCHNSCGHHHIADIGLHGLAKKIDGKPVPHYQFHVGGSASRHGIAGPVVPAHRVKWALRLMLDAVQSGRDEGESVRDWAERLGVRGLSHIVEPALGDLAKDLAKLRYDFGYDTPFLPPATSTGECAAGAVVAEHFADLAQVARQDAARAWRAGRIDDAQRHLSAALDYPLQRLLGIAGLQDPGAGRVREDAVRREWSRNQALLSTLDEAVRVVITGRVEQALPALLAWQNAVDEEVERILAAARAFMPAPRAQGASPDWQPPKLGRIAS